MTILISLFLVGFVAAAASLRMASELLEPSQPIPVPVPVLTTDVLNNEWSYQIIQKRHEWE